MNKKTSVTTIKQFKQVIKEIKAIKAIPETIGLIVFGASTEQVCHTVQTLADDIEGLSILTYRSYDQTLAQKAFSKDEIVCVEVTPEDSSNDIRRKDAADRLRRSGAKVVVGIYANLGKLALRAERRSQEALVAKPPKAAEFDFLVELKIRDK